MKLTMTMRRQGRWMLATACLLAMPGMLFGATSADSPVEAVTKARYDLNLGFIVGGKVATVHVKPGDPAKAGDVLIELEDKEGLATMEIWKFRAESEVAIHAARAKQELSKVEEAKTRELVGKNAAAAFELTRAEIQSKIDGLSVDNAIQDQDEAKRQLAVYRARHENFTLKAPTDGLVEEIIVNPGEMVESLKPVLRLVVTNPLWIDAAVPMQQTVSLKVGDPAWVASIIDGENVMKQGKIIHIAQVADPASDTRLVRVELPNPEHQPAGGQVKLRWSPPEPVEKPNPAPTTNTSTEGRP
ncbi:MAG: efflux RND transporter periplasmic adaptor subunit [Phycisphaeraceae bacterium]|nr:efflux RND transporter periplasmic adaptor subunit [Phycisphaeraceae bacterium]